MLPITRILVLAFILFNAMFCCAQAPQFSQLSLREGLSDNNVMCMLRDSRGYLWLGTLHGLNCYDGTGFSTFLLQAGVGQGLQYNLVRDLAEDKNGNIWIALARNGLQRYDPKTRQWTSFQQKAGDENSLRSEQLNALFVDRRGRIWIGYTGAGWSMYDESKKEFRHYKSPFKKLNRYGQDASNYVEAFSEDEIGNLWIASNYGLHYFDVRSGNVHTFKYQSADASRQNLFTTLFRGDDTTLWLGAWGGGLKKFNTVTKVFTRYEYDSRTSEEVADAYNVVLCIGRKDSDELWIGTADRGLGSFNVTDQKFSFYPDRMNDPASPPAGGINCLLKDSENTLWLGSSQGLHYAALSRQPFHFHPIENTPAEVKTLASTTCFYKHSNGKLYVGMYAGKGLYEIDERKNEGHVIPVTQASIQSVHCIFSMANSSDLLIGCDGTLFRFSPLTHALSELKIPLKNGGFLPACAQLLQTKNGAFWCLCLGRGIYHINKDLSEGELFDAIPHQGTSLLLEEGDSVLWLHSRDVAIFRYHKKTNRVDRISIGSGLDGQIMLRQMLREPDGSYVALSEQMGVFRFWFDDQNHARFKQYTTANGLPSDYGVDLLRDLNGGIWVMTREGPALLQNDHFLPYNEAGGWKKEWNYGSLFEASDSTFYIGAAGGYLSSTARELRRSHPPLRPVLTSLKIFDHEWNAHADLNRNLDLQLAHDRNFLSFSFLAPSLPLATHVRYSWMLEGLDKNWVAGADRRTVTYSGLAPGRYRFRLRASGADGVWYERDVAIHIHILAPFWQTAWFITLVAGFLLVIGILLYRARLQAVRRQEQQKAAFQKQLAEIEMKALRAQMNPHFIFNCLNAINRYIVMSDQVTAADYVAKFAKLIRLILDNSHADRTTLDRELLMLRLYLEMESLRFAGKFSYEIDADNVHSPETILLPSMLIQPYIENAIWHGLLHKAGGGFVRLRLQEKEGLLLVEIEDNGIGRKAAAVLKSRESNPQKSYGMKITSDKIQMLNELHGVSASVEIEDLYQDDFATGTRAVLQIPIQRIQTEP